MVQGASTPVWAVSDPHWVIHQAHKEAEQKKSNFFITSYHYSTVIKSSGHNVNLNPG